MKITNQRKREIVAVFQRSLKHDNKDEVEAIELVELIKADEVLGNRDINSGFRLAMQNRINQLKNDEIKKEQRQYESKIRAWNLVTGILIGLLIAGLSKWLFN